MNNGKVKLNLGGGDFIVDGYRNIDRKFGLEVYPLPVEYADGTVDEIRASHILEHFSGRETYKVLKHWADKLKVGGVIKVAVPDFRKIAQDYLSGKAEKTASFVMGGQEDDNDYHKAVFDEESVTKLLEACGLTNIEKWQDEIQDCSSFDVSLNLMGTKAEPSRLCSENKPAAEGTVTSQVDCKKVAAVISMGRLTFSDNQFCATKALAPLGVELIQGIGVFWGQLLSRSIQQAIDKGKEYILTLDYDTYFNKEQFLYLCWLMNSNPDVDAIVPLQIRREGDFPLLGKYEADRFPKGQKTTQVPMDVFSEPLTPIVTGHFGMTLLRVSALKKLSKPWFKGEPNEDGEWGDNRVDEDIYFWNKFYDEGFKAVLAREVGIGHMQLMCTFAGTWDERWKPRHMYITDVREKGIPEHCLPPLSASVKKGGNDATT